MTALDPTAAQAKAVEAHNAELLDELIERGVDPTKLIVAAIQTRLQRLVDCVVPPDSRGLFELGYEMMFSEFLNVCLKATATETEDE